MDDLEITRSEPRHRAALAELFGSTHFGCYCRFWHFTGDNRAWLARCAHAPDENERELTAALDARSVEAQGLVATLGERAVGWLKLAPALALPKLYDQRLYRGLPCFEGDRHGVLTVGCLLVHEAFRRRGIARALVRGAVVEAGRLGARALEALPRSDTDVADAALMLGPSRIFLEAGFRVVHDFAPYPVLRLDLAPAESGAP